jgi:hypothetical protein
MAVDFAHNAAHEQDGLESVKTSDWETRRSAPIKETSPNLQRS